MEAKRNDKYKKRCILKQIEGAWGYYEFDGNYVLVKNCILAKKYNKIFQIIFQGGDAIDGLYQIGSFDINVHYDDAEEKIVTITNKKYDKIAGYDDCTINAFTTKAEFVDWLIEKGFMTESEKKYSTNNAISKEILQSLPRYILDNN